LFLFCFVKDEEEKPEDEEKEKEEEPAAEDDGRRANETDVQYWQRVLGPAYHEHVIQTLREQEEVAKTLGKGKRIRKQINYAEQEMMAAAIESSKVWRFALI
jgi:chromodomain-helicase-DNA-binding protein 4